MYMVVSIFHIKCLLCQFDKLIEMSPIVLYISIQNNVFIYIHAIY